MLFIEKNSGYYNSFAKAQSLNLKSFSFSFQHNIYKALFWLIYDNLC